jgi:ElaA protein
MSAIQWTYKKYTALTIDELYSILRLRSQVFVVEQNCPYLDLDNKDQFCWHLCGWLNNEPAAYARIIPPGICYEESSIGRVVTNPAFRKNGYGKELMQLAIEKTLSQFTVTSIKIGAQAYLLDFYSNLGFVSTEKHYLEDGIPHVEMLLTK